MADLNPRERQILWIDSLAEQAAAGLPLMQGFGLHVRHTIPTQGLMAEGSGGPQGWLGSFQSHLNHPQGWCERWGLSGAPDPCQWGRPAGQAGHIEYRCEQDGLQHHPESFAEGGTSQLDVQRH